MFLHRALFPDQPSDYFSELSVVQKLAVVCICLLPLFHLTFNDWTGFWVVWSSFFCLISIIQDKKSFKAVFSDSSTKWVIFSLVAYPLAIFLSQLCRLSFNHKPYLDVSPFLYFISVFIFIVWKKIDMGKWMQLVLPIVILGALWSSMFYYNQISVAQWGGDRLTVYFSDPLAFGQIMLTLGLMSLSTIQVKKLRWQSVALSTWSVLDSWRVFIFHLNRGRERVGSPCQSLFFSY